MMDDYRVKYSICGFRGSGSCSRLVLRIGPFKTFSSGSNSGFQRTTVNAASYYSLLTSIIIILLSFTMAGRPPLPQRQAIDPEELDQRQQGTSFSYYGRFWNIQSTQIPLNEADARGCICRKRMPAMYEQTFSAEHLRKDLAQSAIARRTLHVSSSAYISYKPLALNVATMNMENESRKVST
jgi:hypothetical protein